MSRRPIPHHINWYEQEDTLPRPAARPRRVVIDVTPNLLPRRPQRRHERSRQV
jgi:hypothetical protein